MSDTGLFLTTVLASVGRRSRHGKSAGEAGVMLSERSGLSIAAIAARRGKVPAVAEAVNSAYGVELPMTARRVAEGDLAIVWAGPEKWLALAQGKGDLAASLAATLAGMAAVSDQGDGRCVLAVSGPRARDVLAKGLPIDLHPRVFRPGDTALTRAAHIDLQIWQLDDVPAYEIAVLRSFGRSFWRWLAASAAEYGYEVTG